MFLVESDAKELLVRHGLKIPDGAVARSAGEARQMVEMLGPGRYVVKALIHAGGRGLAGGVRLAETPDAVEEAAGALLGSTLVTEQTGPRGEVVEAVYVEAALAFDRSLYLSFLIDPRLARPVMLASVAGGMDFEARAQEMPDIVQVFPFNANGSHDPNALAAFLEGLGLERGQIPALRNAIAALLEAFRALDASLVEINPLALMPDGRVVAIDAKISLDANALFRHPEFERYIRTDPHDPTEMIAQQNEINYVKMDGDIGLVVNGAGLGLATHDMVIEAGGNPANFMDIRTTATSFQVARGIGLLLDNPQVSVVLVNIHGGGMTSCDLISEALSFAYGRAARKLPIIFRPAGQNAEWALKMLREREIPFEAAESMGAAVSRAVTLAAERAA